MARSAPATLKTAVAIRHIHFKDLGSLEAVLAAAGYPIHYYDVGIHELWTLDPLLPDLLIVLGGPVSVYEADKHPFLVSERQLLKARLAEHRPMLGICLGAQQIAATLGAAVAPSGIEEIGFFELELTDAGRVGPLRHFEGVPVLHWHAFQTPEGAEKLAATALCDTQGIAMGRNVLALQFHAEIDAAAGIERWLVGHAAELAAANIDRCGLRDEAARLGPTLRDAARRMAAEWLEGLRP